LAKNKKVNGGTSSCQRDSQRKEKNTIQRGCEEKEKKKSVAALLWGRERGDYQNNLRFAHELKEERLG